MYKTVNRGEVFFADLNPLDGDGKPNLHRVILLQTSAEDSAQRSLVVALITNRHISLNASRVDVESVGFLQKPAIALMDRLWTIKKKCLRKKIGVLPESFIKKINKALAISIGLDRNHEKPLEITLCPKCLASFEGADEFRVRRKYRTQRNQKPCSFCDGYCTGYDYQILRKAGAGDENCNPG